MLSELDSTADLTVDGVPRTPGEGERAASGQAILSSGDERLRIAIVSPEVGPGAGVPHYWLALARALSTRHEVHIFAVKTDHAMVDGVHCHLIPAIQLGWTITHATFYFAALARFSFTRLFRSRPFDLVLGIGALTPFADVVTVHFVQARELELQRLGAFPSERRRGGLENLDYALYSRFMGWLGRRFYRLIPSWAPISRQVRPSICRLP